MPITSTFGKGMFSNSLKCLSSVKHNFSSSMILLPYDKEFFHEVCGSFLLFPH